MEALAIASHLSRYVLAAAAVYFCIHLFRHYHRKGWLLLGVLFLEPFCLLVIRFAKHRPLLAYRAIGQGEGGVSELTYRMDFPLFYIVAVVGLFLLFRETRHDSNV